MSRQGVFLWLPVLIWAGLIFWGSTDLLSEHHTSRLIGPVLRWFAPELSEAAVERAQYVVRKLGHLTEYAILAILIWRGLNGGKSVDARSWSWKGVWLAFWLTVAYAVTDELHQAYVASRFGSGWDVAIDAAGAGLGLAAAWRLSRRRTRR